MAKTISQEELKGLISATAEKLHIKFPAIIEKDYYVTQAINALSGIENEYFRLIFAGGTCLAKAHRIVKRMSEDIDFKIQLKNKEAFSSKTRLIKELKNFRSQIKSSITFSNMEMSEYQVRNDGKYLFAELSYQALFDAIDVLRPHLLLEFTFSDIRLSTEKLNINSIIEDNYPNAALFDADPINCISINETAIEKWVGLTRKIIAIERSHIEDDKHLIRHVYDLSEIKKADKIGIEFLNLAKIIVRDDAEQFKNQHPEYFSNPGSEIQNSLATLKKGEKWKQRYQKFIDTMVYDKSDIYDYEIAIRSLEEISKDIIQIVEAHDASK